MLDAHPNANATSIFTSNGKAASGNCVACVKVEPDIDYYQDLGAYALRWIAGRHAGVPEFDPSYTIVPA